MVYNMDFLIAALIFLLLILYHFVSQRRMTGLDNRLFIFFIVVGIMDIIFDILCTILFSVSSPGLVPLSMLICTSLYLMQLLMPYALLCYTQSLRNCGREKLKKIMTFWLLPCLIMMTLVLANVFNGSFFYFDEAGNYIRGPLYMCMYGFAFFYVLVVGISSLVHRRELGPRKIGVIWEFLVIAGSCVVIQAFNNDLLVAGFGISLGLAVMFFTINNPYGYTDNLTEVFDKQFFVQWINDRIREGKKLNLISIDLYQLKQINTVYGTSIGDILLVRVAQKLQDIAESGYVFRTTGNRFLVPSFSLGEYERNRNAIQNFFGDIFKESGEEIRFPAVICGILEVERLKGSDGVLAYIEYLVSLAPDTEETLLIQDTEKTMEGFRYEQEIQRFLNVAIEEDLFELNYQPIYSLEAGGYVALEALSRLRHPSLGPVSPEIFVSIAEKNGQIARIGYLQFRRLCRFIKENEEIMVKIKNVKFNLSPQELLKRGYTQTLLDVVREYDLPFSYFQFEITETVATEYSENLYQAVEEFMKAGIGLCLDDFGSGYANLNTVLKLPFSSIKLDRSLLSGISQDQQIADFYRSIVSVLRNIGYNVIAEGVETEQEMELLKEWGVDRIQGYYFSRPLSAQRLLELLDAK